MLTINLIKQVIFSKTEKNSDKSDVVLHICKSLNRKDFFQETSLVVG